MNSTDKTEPPFDAPVVALTLAHLHKMDEARQREWLSNRTDSDILQALGAGKAIEEIPVGEDSTKPEHKYKLSDMGRRLAKICYEYWKIHGTPLSG